MDNYKKMYYKLFNAMTETIESLQKVQQEVEEIYISAEIKAAKEEDVSD